MAAGKPSGAVVQFASCRLNEQYRFCAIMTSLLVPLVSVRGMTSLDRDAFTKVVNIPILKLLNIATMSDVMPIIKKYILKLPNFKPHQKAFDEIIVYLNPNIVTKFEDIAEIDRNSLAGQYKCFDKMTVKLKYSNWRYDEILRSVLPEDVQVPTAYTMVGHIVQLNLREVHLPYKNVIGQVFLDKIPNARTVINKVNVIDTTFRYFTMEILAGEKNTITTTKEYGCTYRFDFAQVYWNPRLSTEHKNLTTFMKQGDVLYDVFAGVGPFAIPAARKGVQVFANDLNPESYKWLKVNATTNKVKNNFQAFNTDGREFLRNIVKNNILSRRARDSSGSEHIIMNLPATAVEFLDILPDWFTPEELKKVCFRPPIFHVYCFVKPKKSDDACKLGRSLIEEKIGCTLCLDSLVSTHNVRDVAPNKDMVRVSFLLKENMIKGEEPAMKKSKIETMPNDSLLLNDNVAENNGKEQGCS